MAMSETLPQVVSAPAVEPRKMVARVEGQRIRLADGARNVWRVSVPAEHDPDTCLEPGYLWHRSDLVRPGDTVEMVHELYQFMVVILVARIDRDTQSIQSRIISACDWRNEPLAAVDLSTAIVEKKGATWRVRLGERVLISEKATRAEAQDWLDARKLQVGTR